MALSPGVYLRMTRPVNSAMIGFAVLVGSTIAAGCISCINVYKLIAGWLTGFAISSYSMLTNDIFDVEIDRINQPNRPLPSGRASVKGAWITAGIMAFIGLAAAAYIGLIPFTVAFTALIAAHFYNWRAKRTGLPGNMIVAYSVALPILYGALLVQVVDARITIYWSMVFLSALAREVVKGIADIEGDSIAGVSTVAVSEGAEHAAMAAFALYMTAVALSSIPLVYHWVRPLWYGIPVAFTDAIFVYSSLRLLRSPDRETALWQKKMALLAMLLGLIGFMGGGRL